MYYLGAVDEQKLPLLTDHVFDQDAQADVLGELRELENNCVYAQILMTPVSTCLKENSEMKHKSGSLSLTCTNSHHGI